MDRLSRGSRPRCIHTPSYRLGFIPCSSSCRIVTPAHAGVQCQDQWKLELIEKTNPQWRDLYAELL
ncbi:protein of unknown function [Candidatus Methylomirabilis oxygeniifera]|uniref:Uncharacterized protein n=1 Tax=Methylomirabilis oxygeniifera TaxID=671143 RepID=D5MIJ0_METO1|nr:protein of unknown function [Candidatus Methylomirabilis oxyfera]